MNTFYGVYDKTRPIGYKTMDKAKQAIGWLSRLFPSSKFFIVKFTTEEEFEPKEFEPSRPIIDALGFELGIRYELENAKLLSLELIPANSEVPDISFKATMGNSNGSETFNGITLYDAMYGAAQALKQRSIQPVAVSVDTTTIKVEEAPKKSLAGFSFKKK